jgi:hypothetical protein
VNSHWVIPSLAHFFIALATSWKHQVLLYANSKWRELLYFTTEAHRAAQLDFMMKIELLLHI